MSPNRDFLFSKKRTVDKATKNVAIICKQFYLNSILEECKTNDGIADVTDKSVEVINDSIHNLLKLNL